MTLLTFFIALRYSKLSYCAVTRGYKKLKTYQCVNAHTRTLCALFFMS
jgi:hypothetical protein